MEEALQKETLQETLHLSKFLSILNNEDTRSSSIDVVLLFVLLTLSMYLLIRQTALTHVRRTQ